ncbi:MAG: protein-glutamate O-methyltransferase CheR [Caldimicrobium sp.]|nr:protein-glutamate O-methyltransferase CheR [Caldimicrobium sp.]MCX7874113.1 protein-glutamate O-methyltransferase CheR [Caldimicrobium sp.]MDW8093752.1 protein-glutamate O-methyltransferase CheR [Caldimicrobium sp.]
MEREIFNFFTGLLEKVSGISYQTGKEYLLENRLKELAISLGYKDLRDFYEGIRNNLKPQIINQIVDTLTTNETYFFRDQHPFEAIKKNILPELFQKKAQDKTIKIWSSACSTGQEPYSIALLILEYFSTYISTYKINIYATDISETSLKKAKEGIYNQIEVNRGLPVTFLIKYFKQEGGHWRISDDVKRLVRFEFLNLLDVENKVRERFDLILCRYVLIYFNRDTKTKVFKSLWNCLNNGGYLLLGATEIPPISLPDLEKKTFGNTIVYYKA